MTLRYVGPGGNDGNSGLTWALRKLTLNGAEDTPVVAGDVVHVGPGVYREQLDIDVDGGNTYSAGTVTVTNGSTTVTGAGTAFLANVAADYMFHNRLFASAADGVANGTATFTSAGGNFQANMVGKLIQINARAPYKIGAVAAANSITLVDVNGLGWPGAGGGLTYSVMSGEGSYEIESVTDNTNFELLKPWNGPTLTGLAYLTYNAIKYIGDVTGENTDGVGGIVRITGSDNDITKTRTRCIENVSKDYRLFRGFALDLADRGVYIEYVIHNTFEDIVLQAFDDLAFYTFGPTTGLTIRRFAFWHCHYCVITSADGTEDDTGFVIESSLIIGKANVPTIDIRRLGGVTIRNNSLTACEVGINIPTAPAIGQTLDARNNTIAMCRWAIKALAVGQITEDFNALYGNGTDRTNTATGAGSNTYPSLLTPPLLLDDYKFPWYFDELSEWSQLRAITGAFEVGEDLLGFKRPITATKLSWGAIQFQDMERETGTVRTGSVSMAIRDAGRHQIWVPVEASSTTIRVYVYREANYAGLLPQMIIKQPGVADRITTDVGAAGGWNLLTDTFVPQAIPPYVVVELVSRNTNGAADEVFFDDLDVS